MKRVLFFVMSCVMALAFVGCGKTKPTEEELKAQIADLQAQLTEKEDGSSSDADAATSDNSGSVDVADDGSQNQQEDDLEFTPFKKGETITTDTVEFTVATIQTTKRIDESRPGEYVSHYFESDSGKTFVCLIGDIKNVGKKAIDCQSMYIEYVFDSGYEYNGQIELEKDGEFATFAYLEPLETAKFYIFADIPDDLIGKGEIVNIKLSFNDFQDNRYSLNGTEDNRYVIRVEV